MNRRSFFQTTLSALSAIIFYSMSSEAEERRRGGGAPAASNLTLIDVNDPAAKSVNYVHDTKNIKDVKLQTERSGVKFKDQHCKTCTFYQKDKETTINSKKASTCQMPFAAGKLVSAEGWCSTWTKK